MIFCTLKRSLSAAFLTVALVACGGGGGGVAGTGTGAGTGSVTTTGTNTGSVTGTGTGTVTGTGTGSVTGTGTTPSTTTGTGLDISIIAGALGGRGYAPLTGSAARFDSIESLAFEVNGNLLASDTSNRKIFRVSPAGVVSVVPGGDNIRAQSIAAKANGDIIFSDSSRIYSLNAAGTKTAIAGTSSYTAYANLDGTGTAAKLGGAIALTLASDGTIYFINQYTSSIRKVSPMGVVTTIAGTLGSVTPTYGNLDGTGTAASFYNPSGLALSNDGNKLYVSDTFNNRIRVINLADNVVSHFAGSTNKVSGKDNGGPTAATFLQPQDIRMTADNNLLVAESFYGNIRSVTPAGTVSQVISSNSPQSLAIAADGTVAIAARSGSKIDTLKAGVVATLAGSAAQYGTTDGTGTVARFDGSPLSIAVLPDKSIITASYYTFRRITPVNVVSSQDVVIGGFLNAMTTSRNGDTYYITDSQILKLSAAGVSTVVAGSNTETGVINGTGTAARFEYPRAIAAADDGTVYVVDSNRNTIRKISAAGVVTTLAGNGTDGIADGTGTAAQFDSVNSMVLDSQNNLIVADSNGIRQVTPAGVVVTIGNSAICYGSMTIDAANNLYCASEQTITKITPAGVTTTLVAAPSDGFSVVRTGNVNPSFNSIGKIALLSETTSTLVFVVTDYNELVILKVSVNK